MTFEEWHKDFEDSVDPTAVFPKPLPLPEYVYQTDFDVTEWNKELDRKRFMGNFEPDLEPTGDKLAEIERAKEELYGNNKPALGPMLIAGKKVEFTILDDLATFAGPGAQGESIELEPEIDDEYPIRHGKPDLVSWCAKLLKVPEPTLKRGYFSHYAEAVPGEITVNCPPDSLPRVIFHEMAHQWQFEHGLVITENSGFYRGVETPIKPYWWAPWEIEARGMEDAILHEWGKCTRKKRSKHLKRTLARLLMS